ncbi:MAG TPA: hypothetical protein VF644_03035 [Pyrinomonadaceae bacterium]|jgi:hypothetical protein
MKDEKPSSNGKQMFIVNHDVADQPELINEREIEDIRYALESPLETDQDLEDLGREFNE